MPSYLKDADTTVSIALPASAGLSVITADLPLGSNQGNYGSDFISETEVLITIPAIPNSVLPDGSTLTVQLQNGPAAAPTTAFLDAIVITGADGAGYAGNASNPIRRRLQSNVLSYLNLKATSGSGTGDMSSLTIELAFVY
jgi:hypothetical protein